MTLQPLHLYNIIRFIGYIYIINHPGKEFTFLYSLIFILLFSEHLSYTNKNKYSCS